MLKNIFFNFHVYRNRFEMNAPALCFPNKNNSYFYIAFIKI